MSPDKLETMERLYELGESRNTEIVFRWIRLGLRSRWEGILARTVRLVTEVGRMKILGPIYRDWFAWEEKRQLAIDTFLGNKKCLMQVCANTIENELHLNN